MLYCGRVVNSELHDMGCSMDDFPAKIYKGNNIIRFGPDDTNVCFNNLSSVAINLSNILLQKISWGVDGQKLPRMNAI